MPSDDRRRIREHDPVTGRFRNGVVIPPQEHIVAASAGGKVTVACKLPHGLIMRLFYFETVNEPVMGGGSREVRVARALPQVVMVKGNVAPFGVIPDWPIVAGYGLTHGVDKDFWDEWLQQNQKLSVVKRELITAYEQPEDAIAFAKEHASLKSGLEPLNPDNPRQDQRIPRWPTGQVAIETSDTR